MNETALRVLLTCSTDDNEGGARMRAAITELLDQGWRIPQVELTAAGPWNPLRSPMKTYAKTLATTVIDGLPAYPGYLEFAHQVARLASDPASHWTLAGHVAQAIRELAAAKTDFSTTSDRLFECANDAPALVPGLIELLRDADRLDEQSLEMLRSAVCHRNKCSETSRSMMGAIVTRELMRMRIDAHPVLACTTPPAPMRRHRGGV
jgi:hypothetical protein